MPLASQAELIAMALAGKVVSFPTDTVPALAVKPENSALIFTLKQRSPDKPLILMGANFDDLLPYIAGTPEEINVWQAMVQRYLPGALTLVLPASDKVPPDMNPTDSHTIGIRIPDHNVARQILAATSPLATTSANLSGNPPLETLEAIAATFPTVFTLYEEPLTFAQPQGSGLPSTVAKWTATGWKILRIGSVSLDFYE